MKLKNNLSDLAGMKPLEAGQEGLLRGGFAMMDGGADKPNGQSNTNCDCDCSCNAIGCGQNTNCSCNGQCPSNFNCNCSCVASTTAPAETQPTNPDGGDGAPKAGFQLFAF